MQIMVCDALKLGEVGGISVIDRCAIWEERA
jgi:hypothetical protein